MGLISVFAVLATLSRPNVQAAQTPTKPFFLDSRFELAAPLPTVPGVMVDTYSNGYGIAQQTAKADQLQARIIWIDATANIDKYNTEDKIVWLVHQIKASGFNTIVFDIKPISGQVVYKSAIAPKLTEWKGEKLSPDFDPLTFMCREAKANDIGLFVSMNAFSEGHRLFQVGPGYEKKDWQTVLYEPKPAIRLDDGPPIDLAVPFDKAEPGAVSIFTSADKVPKTDLDGFAIIVSKEMKMLSTVEGLALADGIKSLDKGSIVVYGAASAGAFLKQHFQQNGAVSFDTTANFVPISERPEEQYPLMVNPNNPDVQQYEISLAQEVVREYPVDGIIYDDRFRYGGINADFSELTRAKFEEYVGKKLTWPDDVFKFTLSQALSRGIRPGPYYDAWLAWRAQVLHDYLARVRRSIKLLRPSVELGIYVGSWYGEYSSLGDNYASPQADPGFWYLSRPYKAAGNAPLLDFLISGCYYPTATIYDAMVRGVGVGNCVESAAILTNRLVRDECWTYAGIALSDFKDNPEGLLNALQAACASSQGVMVFDLSHDIFPMWPVFAKAFAQPRRAPHSSERALEMVRRRRLQYDRQGLKEPPIIISAGTAGTGQ
ncbi:MAG: family 10 glycosylhydrolase [Fimbriimonas sp.]|nr:family 10 glycosylhydrolase [Fimbriimonas sp.]